LRKISFRNFADYRRQNRSEAEIIGRLPEGKNEAETPDLGVPRLTKRKYYVRILHGFREIIGKSGF